MSLRGLGLGLGLQLGDPYCMMIANNKKYS